MGNMKKTFTTLFVLGLVAVLSGCVKDYSGTGGQDGGDGWQQQPLPTTDVVDTRYDGTAALFITGQDEILGKLQSRLPNLVDLSGNPDFILFDEGAIPQFISDDAELSRLKGLYALGAAVGCVNPAGNWAELYHEIAYDVSHDDDDNGCRYEDMVPIFESCDFYITKADGRVYAHDRVADADTVTQVIVTTDTDQEGNLSGSTENESYICNHVPNDYQWGREAEKVVEWLNENAGTMTQSPYFVATNAVKGGMDEMLQANLVYTWSPSVKIKHYAYNYDYADSYPDVKVRFTVRAAYSEKDGKDLYDVQVVEEFPANESFVADNAMTRKHLAYRWKYTGHTYAGPEVDMWLATNAITAKDDYPYDATAVDIHGAVPKNEAGSYTVTHVPGSWSVGGSATAGVSGKDFAGSLGFAFNYTMPADLKTTTSSNMPVTYTRTGKVAKWVYDAKGAYYSGPWGSNSTCHRDFPDISVKNCETDQILLFAVDGARQIGSSPMYLAIRINFKTKWAKGGPWKGEDKSGTDSHHCFYSLQLPEVMRYFTKYTPSASGVIADAAEWNSLHTMFKNGNVNYRALCDDVLRIGAPTKDNVVERANTIWDKVVDQLVKEYGKTSTKYEYTVVLKDEDGNRLKSALQIKNGDWKKIELK